MDVLYIGSGLSALQAKDEKYHDHIKVCLNNAWRIYEGGEFDYWIHPGDFPYENYPSNVHFRSEINHALYSQALHQAADRLGFGGLEGFELETQIGYTSFFQGLYWIMLTLAPQRIGLLGFDHDYNPDKTKKWREEGMPQICNNFLNKREGSMNEWANDYFKEYEQDAFYGHGTPDPLRFNDDYIEQYMQLALKNSQLLGVELVNYSQRFSPYHVFPRADADALSGKDK
jgi:hypothetical protein